MIVGFAHDEGGPIGVIRERLPVAFSRDPGQENQRESTGLRVGAKLLVRCDPVLLRHEHVQEHEVKGFLLGERESFTT